MNLQNKQIGFALTGSYCTLEKVFKEVKNLQNEKPNIIPIVSDAVKLYDTRFGRAKDFLNQFKTITKNEIIDSIVKAEPIGPKKLLDALIVAPCTGNTLAKIANGITDTTVTMSAKAHLRNERPLIIAISTNDGLSGNAENIGKLLNKKNVYFVPFGQDNAIKKTTSLVADFSQIIKTVKLALDEKQIQPLLI